MGVVPIFTGRIEDSEAAELVLTESEAPQRLRHRQSLRGKKIEIVIRKARTKRSLDQNAYWHAIPFPILAKALGDDIEGVKFDLLGSCFGWTTTMCAGRRS